MKWLLFAGKNILRNRRRSLVTIMIAAVGSAGIIISGGFALYTYESLKEMAARENGHLSVAQRNYFTSDEDSPMQYGLDNSAELKKRLELQPEVRMALPRVQFSGLLSNGDKSSVFVGAGVDPAGEFHTKGPALSIITGRTLRALPKGDSPPEIMLGTELARQMKAVPGTVLTLLSTTTSGSLNAVDVTVCGTMSAGVPEVDKRMIYVDITTAQRLLLTDKVSTLSVYLRDTEQTGAMRSRIATLFPGNALKSWQEQAFYYGAVRSLYNRIFGLLGVVIVVMVVFAIANTLAMAVVERTREIGTLRALGTLPAQIVRVFALEGVLLGGLGAAAGMLAALGISLFTLWADIQMPPPPGRSVGYPLQITIAPALYLLTLLTIITLAGTAAWLVSRKMAAKPVVEALNHV